MRSHALLRRSPGAGGAERQVGLIKDAREAASGWHRRLFSRSRVSVSVKDSYLAARFLLPGGSGGRPCRTRRCTRRCLRVVRRLR